MGPNAWGGSDRGERGSREKERQRGKQSGEKPKAGLFLRVGPSSPHSRLMKIGIPDHRTYGRRWKTNGTGGGTRMSLRKTKKISV